MQSKIFTEVKNEVQFLLKDLGNDVKDIEEELNQFMADISPDLEQISSLHQLGYVRDALAARAGRIGLRVIRKHRDEVVATVMTVLRLMIRLCLA